MRKKRVYTEQDARREAQERANQVKEEIRIYRGWALGGDLWYVRIGWAAPPSDAPLFDIIQPETVCPNCGQWQHASNGDCLNECRKRGLAPA